MNIEQAKKAGVAAFKAGKGHAPALNKVFITEACASSTPAKLMDAYMTGWTVAMLADNAPLPDMPSVKTLAGIEGSL